MTLTLLFAADHPVFAGHFPDRPIVPGALLLDCAIAAIAAAETLDLFPGRLGAAKFLSPAGPGETLSVSYEIDGAGAIRFQIKATAPTRLIASGSWQCGVDA